MKLAVAQEAFLEDLRARALRKSTLDSHLAVFRLWLAQAEAEGKAEREAWDAASAKAGELAGAPGRGVAAQAAAFARGADRAALRPGGRGGAGLSARPSRRWKARGRSGRGA